MTFSQLFRQVLRSEAIFCWSKSNDTNPQIIVWMGFFQSSRIKSKRISEVFIFARCHFVIVLSSFRLDSMTHRSFCIDSTMSDSFVNSFWSILCRIEMRNFQEFKSNLLIVKRRSKPIGSFDKDKIRREIDPSIEWPKPPFDSTEGKPSKL